MPVSALDHHDEVLSSGCRLYPVQAKAVGDPRRELGDAVDRRSDRCRLHGNAGTVDDVALGVHGQRPWIAASRQHGLP